MRERMTTEDATRSRRRRSSTSVLSFRAEGVLRLLAALAVHGTDELAGGPHAPPPPLGARRRRSHARARADRGARRPPNALRAHVPDRDAEGPNIGLIGSLASMATVSEFGFIQTPYRKVVGAARSRTRYLPRRRRGGEVHDRAGDGGRRETVSSSTTCALPRPPVRPSGSPEGDRVHGRHPAQLVRSRPRSSRSLSTTTRTALMGANMQRQACRC